MSRLSIQSKPLRTVLRWQALATAVCATGFGAWQGVPGALSAVLGGAIPIVAGVAYGVIVSWARVGPAGSALRIMFRAEATKVSLIILLLWLVLSTFPDISKASFFVTFMVSVVIFSTAIAVRDEPTK